MLNRKAGLLLLGTTALGLAALAPTALDDARAPLWQTLVDDARQATETLASVLHITPPAVKDPAVTGTVQPSPEAKPDNAAAAALKQAYTAAANEKIKALGFDPTGVEDTIAAYRSDDLAQGDILTQKIADPLVRTALEWVALREVPQKIGLERLRGFAALHKTWPTPRWLQRQIEAHLLHVQDPKVVEAFFTENPPTSAIGKYALAKAWAGDGRSEDAAKLARQLFRDSDLPGWVEPKFKADFGNALTKADYKYRADRLLYKEQIGPAMRYAAEAGPDILLLAKARAAVIADAASDNAIAAVPEALRKDPGLVLAEAQKLRRADRLLEAANLLQTAPKEPAELVDGDEWWTERRVLARKLLDDGKINSAYVICATPAAVSNEAKIEAQFHAGWIALRFMNEPSRAAYHFAMAAKLAETPTSIARIAYWQGRTAANSIEPDAAAQAEAFYRKAADHGSTYYGQLARDALGLTTELVRQPAPAVTGADRDEAIRVVELLYAAGERDAALTLAIEIANTIKDERQAAALAAVITAQQDAHLALTIGKILCQRGIPVDELAFPTFGIPPYEALQNSAPPPVVYSIARQESAFMPQVVSKAGAKGLMQMIDATARHTATKAGLPFDGARMLTDASFNARLGAAHLGELLAEQGGSYILTFAAYNAGGGRVKQWIDAYGDPRNPGVDWIDWVERIPFTETRNYVQRVTANVTVYKAIFDQQAKSALAGRTDREAKL